MAEFRSAFTEKELINDGVSVPAGNFVTIGEYKVEAGEIVTLGYGPSTTQTQAQGRLYMKLQNATPAEIKGMVRLVIMTNQDIPLRTLFEARTEALNTSATDRTKQIPFAEMNAGAGRDKKIVVQFKSDTTDTIQQENSTLLMDYTRELTK